MNPEIWALLQGLIPGMGQAAAQQPMTPTGLVPGAQPTGPIPPLLMPEPAMAPMPPRPVEPYMTEPMIGAPAPAAIPQTLGAALEPPVPMPRPRPAEAPGGTYAAQAAAKPGVGASDLAGALKGVVAPAAPTPQKVSSPNAPAMGKLQGGNVAELLASLGIGPMQAFPGLKLPSTLGQALGGR